MRPRRTKYSGEPVADRSRERARARKHGRHVVATVRFDNSEGCQREKSAAIDPTDFSVWQRRAKIRNAG